MNPKLLKQQFEKSLETYNNNAIVQKDLAQKLAIEVSNNKSDYNNILELGCGSGLLTKEIVKHIKFRQYYANDLVEKSQDYIKKIVPDCKFYIGDARNIKPNQKMDLIVSNAMFQWFENLEKASNSFKPILNKEGILAFSTFTPENYQEVREITGLSLKYKTKDEIIDIFSKNYKILCIKEFNKQIKFKTPLELLAHMKNTGVNSLSSSHWTIKDVKDFCDKYKQKYPDIRLTYAGIIFICQKIN